MRKFLETYVHSRLFTLNKFVTVRDPRFVDIKRYNIELSQPIQRSDFIPYDDDGNFIEDHVPLFRGWDVCKETSDVISKVAKLVKKGKQYRIYFNTAQNAVLVSEENMCDNCKYNDLAIFFDSELELNPGIKKNIKK